MSTLGNSAPPPMEDDWMSGVVEEGEDSDEWDKEFDKAIESKKKQ